MWIWFVKFEVNNVFIRCGGLNKKISEIMVVKFGCVLNFIYLMFFMVLYIIVKNRLDRMIFINK